jgi:hypothetical protein
VSPEVVAANSDGSTLKATPPSPQSPVGGEKVSGLLTLVAGNASLTHSPVGSLPLSYVFEVLNPSGAVVYRSSVLPAGSGTTSHTVTSSQIEGEKPYSWRARAEYEGIAGPWSAAANFIAPASTGYIRGNELYDPLINGQSIGTLHGPVTFIPGVGVKLESQLAYISYELDATLFEGEFSILVTNLHTNTEGGKTKLMAMGEGYADIVTNEYRMTVEKRGEPPGIVAWRFIARDDQIDTEGAEREFVRFDETQTYLWRATWRNNWFNVEIKEGGANGTTIYDKGKQWQGRGYEPDPHVIYVGAPVGRSGAEGASVDGVIVRQVWVSGRERPEFASQ